MRTRPGASGPDGEWAEPEQAKRQELELTQQVSIKEETKTEAQELGQLHAGEKGPKIHIPRKTCPEKKSAYLQYSKQQRATDPEAEPQQFSSRSRTSYWHRPANRVTIQSRSSEKEKHPMLSSGVHDDIIHSIWY
ncbi:hypothetical protein C8R44DRAFT_728534 [Mycena epipterygia]|nr:hypothetical protein C8R44DRAFT_728534 [Mycena epipterygia]